jgi:hypothetical protein
MTAYLFAVLGTEDDGIWIEASNLEEAQDIAYKWKKPLLWQIPKRIGIELTKEWITHVSRIGTTTRCIYCGISQVKYNEREADYDFDECESCEFSCGCC